MFARIQALRSNARYCDARLYLSEAARQESMIDDSVVTADKARNVRRSCTSECENLTARFDPRYACLTYGRQRCPPHCGAYLRSNRLHAERLWA